ncbi:MAG: SH3 domain-containing protein [Candidatus Gracilibacteria bacterium]|nr:SH3 domain-containing protein [Candidatus Gracilibacteria bacterium]
MKKIVSFLLILLNLGLDTVIASEKITDDDYNKASVNSYAINIRTSPNFNSKVIKTLRKNSVIKYYGKLNDGFIEIRYTGKDGKEYSGYTLGKLLKPVFTKVEEKKEINPLRKNWKLEGKKLSSDAFRNPDFPYSLNVLSYKKFEIKPTKNLEQVNNSYIKLSRYYDVLVKLYMQDKQKAVEKDIRANDGFIIELNKIFLNMNNYILYLTGDERDMNIAGNGNYEGLIKSPKTCIIGYTNLNLGGLNATAGMMPVELDKAIYKDYTGLFFALADNQVLDKSQMDECRSQINEIMKDKDFIVKTLINNKIN